MKIIIIYYKINIVVDSIKLPRRKTNINLILIRENVLLYFIRVKICF